MATTILTTATAAPLPKRTAELLSCHDPHRPVVSLVDVDLLSAVLHGLRRLDAQGDVR